MTMVAILTFSPAAQASVGVGIQENPVSLQRVAHPGKTYALPAVHVADTGTQAESIVIKVERVSRGDGRKVPASWIHISSSQLRLAPLQEVKIPLQLVVPADAKSGSYVTDVVAIGSAVIPSTGTNFGAAAATKLTFRIVPGPGRGLLASLPPSVWGLIAVLLLVALILVLRPFIKVRILVTRRKVKRWQFQRCRRRH